MMRNAINDQYDEQLSAEGVARRDAMLDELIGAMRQTHRVRRTRRVLTAAGAFAVAFLTLRVWMSASVPPTDVPRFTHGPDDPPFVAVAPPEAPVPGAVIAMVHTDPAIVERYRAEPVESHVLRLTDRSLLETLATIHRPSGLIYRDNRVVLSTPVTDEELGLRRVER